MKKIKTRALVCVALLLLVPSFIQHGKAATSCNNLWYEYWHDGIYENYPGYPENISSTVEVYDSNLKHWAKVALVVSVYQYEPYIDLDMVAFRVALYWDSFAAEGFQPIPADYVNLYFDKDTDSSNLNNQSISMEVSATPPGFSQGYLLDQSIYESSTFDDRAYWA